MVLDRKTNFFLGKRWFGRENLGKRWFWREKPYFPRENKKNHLFGVWPHSVSKDVFFLVFPRKKLVFHAKTIFSQEKVGFPVQNHLFPRENQKDHLFGVWPHSVSKDGFFGFP